MTPRHGHGAGRWVDAQLVGQEQLSPSEPYGGGGYARAQCTSGNCRTGAGFTCGCGGKASQCPSDEYCGGAYADTCTSDTCSLL